MKHICCFHLWMIYHIVMYIEQLIISGAQWKFSGGRVTLWWSRGVLDLFGKNFQLFLIWYRSRRYIVCNQNQQCSGGLLWGNK